MDIQAQNIDIEVEYQDEEMLMQQQEERMQAFGSSLAKMRDEWVRTRYSQGVDKRWIEDIDQYNSKDNINKAASQMMASVEQGYPVTTQGSKPQRSTVYIGLTRQKTNAGEARLSDILLPTDDRNWGIQPTPIPELSDMIQSDEPAIDPRSGQQMVNQQGQPIREKDIARRIREIAMKRAEAMQREIDDQLNECDYNGEVRKMLHDAAVMGTGVLKGPIVTNRVRKAWQPMVDAQGQQVQVIEMVEELNPASFRVDPRNFWPDPACGESIHNGKGVFERDTMTAKQVRELAKQPGYMKDKLRAVLEEGPKRSATMTELTDEDQREQMKEIYEVWTYWGEVDHDDLECVGVEVGEKDALRTVSGCVVFINSTVVKAFLNPLDTGDLPYDTFPWEKVAGSVWGYGIPYMMRSQQKVLNAAWRQMMDNSGVSSGPQIVVKPTVVQPADKQWQLTGRKLWYATDDIDDVSKAFATFEFNNHQQDFAQIIAMASELADQETGLPQLTQGEKTNAPDTVGGMQMLMNAANVVLRRLVKQFDDYVTKPHIRRYYDYNMMYNDNEEIKGDFNIDARGSSALLIRDIQNQAFLNLLAAGANPIYGVYLDSEKLFKKALQAQHIDPAEVFKSDEEIDQIKEQQAQAAQQQQPQDPRIIAAQMRAQTEGQKAQLMGQVAQAEAQSRLQVVQMQQQAKLQELAMMREIEMLKLAQEEKLSLEEIKAKLADTAIRERGKKELFGAEQRIKMLTGSGI